MMVDARNNYYFWSLMSGVPIIGDIKRSVDQMHYMDDYMRNTGMSYSDIKYPSLTMGGSAFSGTFAYVSKNIGRLYK